MGKRKNTNLPRCRSCPNFYDINTEWGRFGFCIECFRSKTIIKPVEIKPTDLRWYTYQKDLTKKIRDAYCLPFSINDIDQTLQIRHCQSCNSSILDLDNENPDFCLKCLDERKLYASYGDLATSNRNQMAMLYDRHFPFAEIKGDRLAWKKLFRELRRKLGSALVLHKDVLRFSAYIEVLEEEEDQEEVKK